jgi:hypothetical protein
MHLKPPIGPPATLADVRWLDARWLLASCKACGQETILDIEALPDFVPLSWFAANFVCNRCGGVSAYILPNWTGASATERSVEEESEADIPSGLATALVDANSRYV